MSCDACKRIPALTGSPCDSDHIAERDQLRTDNDALTKRLEEALALLCFSALTEEWHRKVRTFLTAIDNERAPASSPTTEAMKVGVCARKDCGRPRDWGGHEGHHRFAEPAPAAPEPATFPCAGCGFNHLSKQDADECARKNREAAPAPAPASTPGSLWTTPAPTGPIEGPKVDESVTADDIRAAVAKAVPRAAAFSGRTTSCVKCLGTRIDRQGRECRYCSWKTDPAPAGRSVQRRIAAQKGEPAPVFEAPASAQGTTDDLAETDIRKQLQEASRLLGALDKRVDILDKLDKRVTALDRHISFEAECFVAHLQHDHGAAQPFAKPTPPQPAPVSFTGTCKVCGELVSDGREMHRACEPAPVERHAFMQYPDPDARGCLRQETPGGEFCGQPRSAAVHGEAT